VGSSASVAGDEYRRLPVWGTPPRDPALILVAALACGFAGLAWSSSASSHPLDFVTLAFGALLIAGVLMLVGTSGVWVSDDSIRIRFGLFHRTLAKQRIAGFTFQPSRWTNGIRVLSLVSVSGQIIPVPGWWLRNRPRDLETVELLQRGIGTATPLPMLLT
jgi:hypothetical protein